MVIENPYPTYDGKQTYDVRIPGIQDIIRIPPLDSPDLKKERVRRMQAHNSPLPHWLEKIPSILTYIDDCQDVLITTLLAGRFVLKRLPERIVPALGWVLLGNDVLNLMNFFLGTAVLPRLAKVNFFRSIRGMVAGRAGRVTLAHKFLDKRFPWVPFLLQGGQVLESYTGWGLRLGALMSALSDTFWGLIRGFGGDHFVITGPPPSDISSKAARVMYQSIQMGSALDVLNEDESLLMLLGTAASAQYIREAHGPTPPEDRLAEMAQQVYGRFSPWESSTVGALQDVGWDEYYRDARPCLPTEAGQITCASAMQVALAANPDIDIAMCIKSLPKKRQFPLGLVAQELSIYSWEAFMNGIDRMVPDLSPIERMMGIAIENGIVPPWDAKFGPPHDPGPAYNASGGQSGPSHFHQRKAEDAGPATPLRIKPAYPAPYDDPISQLLQWMHISLALMCGRPLLLPDTIWSQAERWEPALWIKNTRRWGTYSPQLASLLVWGSIYYQLPRSNDPITPDITRRRKNCVPDKDGFPTLSGFGIEPPELLDPIHPRLPYNTIPSRPDLHGEDHFWFYDRAWFQAWIERHPWPYYPPDPRPGSGT